ncbi:hypothetical protein V8G54_027117 [Vigna mungo]|uniref:Uncharacterized protein n=1 Tax=Vigna mungo TaxID=3915 RepID=A0AAQ3N1V4_VIGMU
MDLLLVRPSALYLWKNEDTAESQQPISAKITSNGVHCISILSHLGCGPMLLDMSPLRTQLKYRWRTAEGSVGPAQLPGDSDIFMHPKNTPFLFYNECSLKHSLNSLILAQSAFQEPKNPPMSAQSQQCPLSLFLYLSLSHVPILSPLLSAAYILYPPALHVAWDHTF